MTNTLLNKMIDASAQKMNSTKNIPVKKKPIFDIDSEGVLHGFTTDFVRFVEDNLVFTTADKHTETKKILERKGDSSFFENRQEFSDNQGALLNHKPEKHPLIKLRQFIEKTEKNFTNSDCLLFSFKNRNLRDYGININSVFCETHLENMELGIKKVARFPDFNRGKRQKNIYLPNRMSDINIFMTSQQVLSTSLDEKSIPASLINVVDIASPKQFSEVAKHWNTEIIKYFNRFTSEQQALVKEGLFRRLEKHPFKLFFIYDYALKHATRIMFYPTSYREGKYKIHLATYCPGAEIIENIVRENISDKESPVEVNHQPVRKPK